MDIDAFGQRLKELRNNKSQADIVKLIFEKTGLSITAQTYGRYENGKRKPDIEIIEALANTFDVSADYLLGLTKTPTVNGDERKFCEESGLSDLSAQILFSQMYTDIFNKMFESPFFEDLLSIIEEVDEQSRIWLDSAEKSDFISKLELDWIDTFRYRAHKQFDILLDDFDQRSYNKELTEQINTKTNEYKGKIENEIGRLKVLYFSTSDEEERQKLLMQISELRHK